MQTTFPEVYFRVFKVPKTQHTRLVVLSTFCILLGGNCGCTLEPGVEAEQDDAWPGDQGVVVQCVVDGQVSFQADEAQGQHADDDEAVVGPAHERTQ
jgi:hypothetical protein